MRLWVSWGGCCKYLVEIVNINADYFEKEWMDAAKLSNQSGINLYAGPYSELLYYYNAKSRFPTKMLYNRAGEHVDVKIKTVADLLSLE